MSGPGARRPYLPTDPEEQEFVPQVSRRRRLGDWLIVTVLVVLVVVAGIVGVGLFGQFLSGVEIAVTDVEPGTCFTRSGEVSDGDFPNIWVADCAGEHHGEVIARLTWADPEAAYPGAAAIEAFAFSHCFAAFRDYVGIDYGLSELELALAYPSRSDWGRRAHLLSCVVVGAGGANLTGSVRDSKR